ncbi:hypothetical protein JIR001_23940 [Polycladomyces abyssicola]|uniref:Myb-like domain-containing protein n=1 Tax=Polycladomyces abyssicola TaxID=1125966 RepID=A0A8D5UHL7_9BACL|nr:hypothetical protein [Polycladomyces abyssicola]BCU82611.1 hypothetical protein JIR001_23940 [Polycladomyces abyssicola]
MFDTKKGKYTDEENETIIEAINRGLAQGRRERDILKELADTLNRGYAGIMSHVRKLRTEFPERFPSNYQNGHSPNGRMNSWSEEEEETVIQTVNRYLDEGKSLSSAIAALEKQLSRTQGAIYQRIYTLRRKYPDRFNRLPEQRPRRRRRLQDWQIQRPEIRSLDGTYSKQQIEDIRQEIAASHEQENPVKVETNEFSSPRYEPSSEEKMILKAFEKKFGKPNATTRDKLLHLMRKFGCTRVSIALFTITEDKAFPAVVVDFLEQNLGKNHTM